MKLCEKRRVGDGQGDTENMDSGQRQGVEGRRGEECTASGPAVWPTCHRHTAKDPKPTRKDQQKSRGSKPSILGR